MPLLWVNHCNGYAFRAAGCPAQSACAGLAQRLHQGSHDYADAAVFAKRLDADVIDKKALLQRVGLVK